MSNFTKTLIFEHNLAVMLQRNGINPPNRNEGQRSIRDSAGNQNVENAINHKKFFIEKI